MQIPIRVIAASIETDDRADFEKARISGTVSDAFAPTGTSTASERFRTAFILKNGRGFKIGDGADSSLAVSHLSLSREISWGVFHTLAEALAHGYSYCNGCLWNATWTAAL